MTCRTLKHTKVCHIIFSPVFSSIEIDMSLVISFKKFLNNYIWVLLLWEKRSISYLSNLKYTVCESIGFLSGSYEQTTRKCS